MNQEVQISEKRLNEILTENINLKIENSKLEKEIKILKKENKDLKQTKTKVSDYRGNEEPQKTQIKNDGNKKQSLKEKLYTQAYRVTTKKGKINETETIKSYVSKLFKILNYDYTNTSFKSEYQLTGDNKNRVDLSYYESKNKNFICECKKLNTNFNSRRGGEKKGETPTEQIRRYLRNTNETNIGILTDGLKIQIHLKDLNTGELLNKYYNINLSHLEDNDLEILKDLSRENFNVEKFINKYGQ